MTNDEFIGSSTQSMCPMRLMVPFNGKGDYLDTFLYRFETKTYGQSRPERGWGTTLSLCLTPEALNTFCRMPSEETLNQENLKIALLCIFPMNGQTG